MIVHVRIAHSYARTALFIIRIVVVFGAHRTVPYESMVAWNEIANRDHTILAPSSASLSSSSQRIFLRDRSFVRSGRSFVHIFLRRIVVVVVVVVVVAVLHIFVVVLRQRTHRMRRSSDTVPDVQGERPGLGMDTAPGASASIVGACWSRKSLCGLVSLATMHAICSLTRILVCCYVCCDSPPPPPTFNGCLSVPPRDCPVSVLQSLQPSPVRSVPK